MRTQLSTAVSIVVLVATLGCREDGGTGTRTPLALTVSPALAATGVNGATSFTATDDQGALADVTWRVNGNEGGSAVLGRITSSGTYTAPATIPGADSVVVTAVSRADGSVRASATLFFLPDNTSRAYYVAIPRAIDATRPAPMRFIVVPAADAASVVFRPITGGQVPLTPIGAGAHTFTLDAAAATSGYTTGALHNLIGQLDYRSPAGATLRLALLPVNVRDATMPDAVVTPLAPDAQKGTHVLNVRVDTAAVGPRPEIVSRALQVAGGDLFDFVAFVSNVTSNANRHYISLRNDVSGIGLPLADQSAPWGGAGRLRGLTVFPLDAYFDGADQAMTHEIGHAWINFATDQTLGAGRPHWPPSTMAHGVMGMSIPGIGAGGEFRWSITWLGNGTARVQSATPTDLFTPLDLYLMGVLSPDSVPAVTVLAQSVDPLALTTGDVVPASTYTIQDYIAAMGPRAPTSATAPRAFRVLCLVVTYGRLLTDAEMAFFDTACARAETRTPVPTSIGLANRMSSGFFLATGGRATLTTRLP